MRRRGEARQDVGEGRGGLSLLPVQRTCVRGSLLRPRPCGVASPGAPDTGEDT